MAKTYLSKAKGLLAGTKKCGSDLEKLRLAIMAIPDLPDYQYATDGFRQAIDRRIGGSWTPSVIHGLLAMEIY